MAAADETSDSLWDASVCRKSWAELVDEEEQETQINENKKTTERLWTRRSDYGDFKLPALKEESVFDEEANLGKADSKSEYHTVASLPTFGKNLSNSNSSKTPTKKEIEVPQEDISLTGHLDVKLGLRSPIKTEGGRFFSVKSFASRSSPSKLQKRKMDNSADKESDQSIQPSPSKILRSTPKKENTIATTPRNDMVTRKRVRDMLTPTPSKSVKRREKRDSETDPDILARRQRQIDYGKNTLGYERYREVVPKEHRLSIHPKTPPIGIKFSRRAWDGLIRVWRQRLHFWDPPSEGGGNPETLEIPSDMSDCSSMDGSLPNTPVQEIKRKRGERFVRTSTSRREVEDDDGCTPLPD